MDYLQPLQVLMPRRTGLRALVLLLFLFAQVQGNRAKCKLKCGVLAESRGPVSLIRYVEAVWREIRSARGPLQIDLQFVAVKERERMTLGETYDAYLEIGTSNISAVIGRFMQAVAIGSEKFNIPYFVTSEIEQRCMQPYNVISVFPEQSELYRISVDVIKKFEWKELAVFYETTEGIQLIENLVQIPDLHVRSWKIDNSVGQSILREYLLKVRSLSVTQLIVMTSRVITAQILVQNQDETDLQKYAYTDVNLTTLNMPRPLAPSFDDPAKGYFTHFEYATIYDSLLALYNGVRIHHRNTGNCYWVGTDFLLPTLSKVSDTGATGNLAFRRDGSRKGYVVDVLSLSQSGMQKIGLWNSSISDEEQRLYINDTTHQVRIDSMEYPLGKDVVKVVTILEEPFTKRKNNYQYLRGNDRYEGFCMDLLKEIAQMLGFEYEVYLVPDEQYGDKNPDGTWSGVIGELLNAEASMAVAPLTINTDREAVIDFSKPYKTFGISMIMKKPENEDSFFQFLDPLSPTVWLLLGGVLVLVSLTFCMMDKVAPADDPGVRFDAIESTWFTFASMVVSGTDVIPRTISGRILAASLWFFSLIIISSYTANLAAFLTVSKFHSNIKSVTDLLRQSEVSYGTVTHSEVSHFFANSKMHQFQQMWQIMSTLRPGGMAKNAAQGFAKVASSNTDYAFLFDAPVIQHKVFTNCNMIEVGKPFDARSYGIAVPRGARYRDDISMAILKLGELGRIGQLEAKWWDETRCPPRDKALPSNTRSLTIHKVGGVFVILAVGVAVSLAAGVMDYYYKTRRKRIKTKKRDISENHDSGDSHLQAHGKLLHDASPSVHFEETFVSNSTTNPGSKHTNIF